MLSSECERRRATAASSTIRGGFVPVCTPQGAFEKVQVIRCSVSADDGDMELQSLLSSELINLIWMV